MNAVAINSMNICCRKYNTLLSKFKVKKQLTLFLTFLFLGTFLTFGQSFPGTIGAIDDDNCPTTNDFTATVAGIGTLGTTNFFNEVVINITHTYDEDLEITLIAPSGTGTVLLSAGNGGSGDNFTDTHFRLDAATSIGNGSAPFTGSFLPDGNLADFDGINANGTWTLQICDSAGDDVGTVDSWEVTFGTEAVEPVTCDNPINPSPSCNALNVIVILDESGSIDSATEGQVEAASLALANALKDTGAQLAFVEFATSADIPTYGGFTNWNTVNQAYINGLNDGTTGLVAQYGDMTNTTSQYTNWEDALLKVLDLNAIMTADIVLFMTDGNPNRSVDGSGNPTTSGDHVQDAADIACLIKQQGSHMFALGVGTGINEPNLISVTGPIQDDGPGNPALTVLTADYGLISAGDLTQCFLDIAQSGCNNDLTLDKTVYAGHDNGFGIGLDTIENPADSKVTYVFTIINDGDQTISNLTFSDLDIGIDESDLLPTFSTSLAAAVSFTYYYEATLPANTVFPFVNTAEVFGETPAGDPLSDSDTAEVTEPLCTPPTLTTQDGFNCGGTSAGIVFQNNSEADLSTLVTSSGGTVTYHLSQADADNNDNAIPFSLVFPEVETTYYVRNEVAADCYVTDTITISQYPLLGLTVTDESVICNDDNGISIEGSLTVNLTNGQAPFNYLWSNGDPAATTTSDLFVGNYVIFVQDANGCTAQAFYEITEPLVFSASATGTDVTCNDGNGTSDDGSIDVTVTNGVAPFTFDWNDDSLDGIEDPTGLAAGTYSVTVTDTNGCSAATSYEVMLPEVLTASASGGGELTCANLTVQLLGSSSKAGVTYSWSGPNAFSSPIQNPIVNEAGDYTLTVFETATGCTDSASVSVTSDTTVPTADAGADAELTCSTLEVTLDGSGSSSNPDANLSYAWSGPNSYSAFTEDITVTEIGTYTLTVIDNDNGCFATDSAEVTVESIIDLTVDCPTEVSLDSCTSEADILLAYTEWQAGFGINDGDSPTSNIGDIPALPAYDCGAAIDLSFTLTATDACNPNGVSCTSSFVLSTPEPLMLIGHCDFTNDLDGCSTSDEIAVAFGNWKTGLLSNFGTIGGCNAEVEYSVEVSNLVPPTICGTQDQVISVFINAKDDCGETQPIECTFTVRAFESTLALDEVEDESYPSCNYETQDALNLAFQDFLDKFGYSGGCDASGQFASAYSAPDLCAGGTVNVTYNVTDLCESQDELASFEIVPSDQLEVSCPTGVILGSSLTAQEISDAYDLWVADFGYTGGCDVGDNLNGIPALPNYDCGTGVNISFDYIATDRCNQNGVTCSSTFFVPGVTGLTVDCPTDVTKDSCTSEADILSAYNAWQSGCGVNNGDNPTSNIGDIPALPAYVCGAAVDLSFTLSATDFCNPNGVSCTSTFKIDAAEDLALVGDCPTANEVNGCSTNTEISAAFDIWKAAVLSNFSATGGCNADVEYSTDVSNLQAPTQCGSTDQIISVNINAGDDCGKTTAITCSFTVKAFDSTLNVTDVADESYASCDYASQGELDTAFQSFLDKFGYSGGCDASGQFASAYSAPDLCIGGTVNVTYSVTDLCETQDELASFEIIPSDQLEVNCPTGVILGSSLTAQEISDAYDLWVADFGYTGGCNASDNLNGIPSLPNYDCGTGVNISFDYIATDRCNPNGVTCSSTFFVPGVTGLTVDCPTAENLDSCTNEADILLAYNVWIDGFGVNDGDNPTSNIGDIPALPAYLCGAEVDLSFTLTATDACNSNGVSCTSTFKVGAAEDLALVGECPTENEVDGCSTNAEISAAFDIWKAALLSNFSATGGCNAEVEYSTDISALQAPTQCGTADQVISVDINAGDDCAKTIAITCSFTVKAFESTLATTDVADESYASCDYADETALNGAFQDFLDKFGFTGGCDASGQLASAYSAPDLCSGGTVNVTYNVTDLCENGSETASFTITPSAALEVSCPTAVALDSSTTQQEIEDAYDAWKLGFTTSGGCNSTNNLGAVPSLPSSVCDTEISLSFDFIATDRCNPNGVTCSSTFNVEGKESVDAGENASHTICEDGTVTAEELFEALAGDPNEGGLWSPEPSGAGIYTYTVLGTDPCPDDSATVIVEELDLHIFAYEPICDEEIGTYSVNVEVSDGIVSSSLGTPVNLGGDLWTIIDIPNDNDIVVTTTSIVSNGVECTESIDVISPDCICIELEVSYADITCFGLDDGTITVDFVTEGATVTVNGDLYNAAMLYVPGTYIVVAFFEGNDDEDCIITQEITIVEPALVDVQVSSTDVTCYGLDDGTITIESLSEGAFYTIKLNGIGPDLSEQAYFAAGTYVVVASLIDNSATRMSSSDKKNVFSRSQNPCVDGKLVVIGEPDELICKIGSPLSGDLVKCQESDDNILNVAVLGGTGPYTYEWTLSKTGRIHGWVFDSATNGTSISYLTGLENARFIVEITDANGCTTTCEFELSSTCTKSDYYNMIGRYNAFDFELFPNPTKGQLTIKPNKLSDNNAIVELYDLIGTRIFSQSFNKISDKEININLTGLASQVYYLKVITKDGFKIKKVILDK